MATFGMNVKITGRQGLATVSLPKAISTWESEIAPALVAEIRRRAPVSQAENGGRLRDSINISRSSSGAGVVARITSSAPYAKYVESGTNPHRIEARQALALHWTDRGQSMFARGVNHPGTKPNPFVREAVQSLMPMMKQKLSNHIQEEFQQ